MDGFKKIVLYTLTSFLMSVSLMGQGILVSPSATLTSFGGNIVIAENLANNGTLTDLGGTITFTGANQSIKGFSISTFNNITVNSGSNTTIESPQKAAGILSVNGTLNSNGFMTLISTALKTALINGAGTGQISGNVTMERYLPSGFGYKYISSPFQSSTVNELGDDINISATFPPVYSYDENRTSAGWVNHSAISDIFNPFSGYAVNFGGGHAAVTFDLSGVVNNGSRSIVLYNNNRVYTKGFNLVGNPYPSPIDWKSPFGWTRTNIDDAIYFFKGSDTDQYGGYYTTFIGGLSSDGITTNIIPSMQGFFVHVTDGTYPVTGTITMDNKVRVTDQSQSYIKGDAEKPLIRFSGGFSDNVTTLDYAVIYFDEKSTLEFDGQLDALKLMNSDINVPNFYFVTPGEINLQIYALPPVVNNFCKVPLGIKISRDGYVIVKIRDIDPALSHMRISIKDMVKGTDQELISDMEFKIYLNAGEYKNRFFLNMSDIITQYPENSMEQEIFSIYYSWNTLDLTINKLHGAEATLLISNLLGQTILAEKISAEGHHEINMHLSDGIYIATLVSGGSRSSKNFSIINK